MVAKPRVRGDSCSTSIVGQGNILKLLVPDVAAVRCGCEVEAMLEITPAMPKMH